MPNSESIHLEAKSIVLPHVLDLNAASRLLEELNKYRGKDLLINASDVDRVGTQCIQVLCAAAKTWKSDGQTLMYNSMSDQFRLDLATLGLPLEFLTAGE